MKRIPLGRTDITVSQFCLGTMTYGSQTPEEEAYIQIETALDAGVDFLDTAEAYPVPMDPKWAGRSEEIIGNWCTKTGRRDELVIATKVAGGGNKTIRAGSDPDGATMRAACEASLKRLKPISRICLAWRRI